MSTLTARLCVGVRVHGATAMAAASLIAAFAGPAAAAGPALGGPGEDIRFAVSQDEPVQYPASARYLPDEHVTMLPDLAPRAAPPTASAAHFNHFFVSMANQLGGKSFDGAFVLQSRDFRHFAFAPGFGDARHGSAIIWAAHPGSGNCNYRTVTHFDEQYAGPGAVLQDPTLPSGNLLMIYEAEIHCPASPAGMAAGWVSIGVARSSDDGRAWPPPLPRLGLENDWLEYGDGRYAGVTLPGSPTGVAYPAFYGDSLPSAFIDDKDPTGDYYVYVPYQFTGAPGTAADARIHMARAWLGSRSGRRETGQLHFHKWYQGGWNAEGRGGLEDAATPPCGAIYGEGGAQIAYNDALHRYMMTFVCTSYICPAPGKCTPTELSLFFTTASSLSRQDWTRPRLIEHSTYRYATGPGGGQLIDGAYPSFVSPGCAPGHLGLSGVVYVLKGDPLGDRRMVLRTFTITPPTMDRPLIGDGCDRHG